MKIFTAFSIEVNILRRNGARAQYSKLPIA